MFCTSVGKIKSKTPPEKEKEENLNPVSWQAGNGPKPKAFQRSKDTNYINQKFQPSQEVIN